MLVWNLDLLWLVAYGWFKIIRQYFFHHFVPLAFWYLTFRISIVQSSITLYRNLQILYCKNKNSKLTVVHIFRAVQEYGEQSTLPWDPRGSEIAP